MEAFVNKKRNLKRQRNAYDKCGERALGFDLFAKPVGLTFQG